MPPDGRSLLAMSVLIFLALWPKTPQPAQVAAPYSSPYLTGSTYAATQPALPVTTAGYSRVCGDSQFDRSL